MKKSEASSLKAQVPSIKAWLKTRTGLPHIAKGPFGGQVLSYFTNRITSGVPSMMMRTA